MRNDLQCSSPCSASKHGLAQTPSALPPPLSQTAETQRASGRAGQKVSTDVSPATVGRHGDKWRQPQCTGWPTPVPDGVVRTGRERCSGGQRRWPAGGWH